MITFLAALWWCLWIAALTTRKLLLHIAFILLTIAILGATTAWALIHIITERSPV
jgi:hypothetical protein